MSELSLPSSVDFSKKLPSLPDGVSSSLMAIQATNGIQFSAGQLVQFDLPAREGLYLDGKTAFLRFRLAVVGSTATAPIIRRKPAYSVINKLDEFVGSVPTNSVFQYNQVANMWIDANFSLADVAGQAVSFGLEQDGTLADVDGVTCTANGTRQIYCAVPLVCSALIGCDKLLPTGLMGSYRVQLTLASLAEVFTTGATNVSGFTINQPELCIQAINMGTAVDRIVAGMGDKLYIRTNGWANSTQSTSATSAGAYSLPFNHRYESIEALYFLSSSTDVAKALNLWGDSFNPLGATGVNGSIQFQIGNSQYPLLPINNSTGGVASVQQYLRACAGLITDQRNTMSITFSAFDQYANGATASTANVPAKFIIGVPLNRVNANTPYSASSLLSGVSATQSPILAQLNAGSAFNSTMSFSLIAEYTELIEIDPVSKQVSVVC